MFYSSEVSLLEFYVGQDRRIHTPMPRRVSTWSGVTSWRNLPRKNSFDNWRHWYILHMSCLVRKWMRSVSTTFCGKVVKQRTICGAKGRDRRNSKTWSSKPLSSGPSASSKIIILMFCVPPFSPFDHAEYVVSGCSRKTLLSILKFLVC